VLGFSFLLFTLMMHNNMTPNTGEDDMYWALILRIGLGLLFVPITTYRYLLYLGKILVKELHLQV
jgi:DHA2 family multidrug resistance protein